MNVSCDFSFLLNYYSGKNNCVLSDPTINDYKQYKNLESNKFRLNVK